MSEAEPTIELTDAPQADFTEFLRQGLIEENRAHLGEWDQRPLALLVHIRNRLVGGLLAETARQLLFINYLWITTEYRRQGLGARLLAAAESEARRRDCQMAWLDTFDFQARRFYERCGYTVFGELAGLPNGHRRLFMSKRLDGSTRNP